MLQLVHNCLVRISVYSASFEREDNFKMQFDYEPNECETGLHPNKNTKDVLSSIHMHIWN